jgi:type VI secretion system protein ImpE
MTARELYQAGKLKEAIQALGSELRDHPTDAQRRTFLYELLCFAGDYSRAEKHLSLLAQASPDAEVGALLYRSAMMAERKREAFFDAKDYLKADQEAETKPLSGSLNGEPFQTIEDADPRIGARLEVFVAGEYVWLPFEHLGSLTMEQPRRLRDLIWSNAVVMAGPALQGKDFGQVLLPVLYPFSWKHPKDSVKLGRETEWTAAEGSEEDTETPSGQKLLLLDGERIVPFLEIRSLEFHTAEPAEAALAN